ncbi:MAG: hypothetical protein SPK79_00285, partial [Erysipelotrichaceae bacterium]|nr:hypothetical protein [Erysipelotrichaceae bacterium]
MNSNYDEIIASVDIHLLECTCKRHNMVVHGYYTRKIKTINGNIDKRIDPAASFYSAVFTNRSDKSDKINLLEKQQNFMFTQDAQKEIEINGLEFGYNQMYLEEIEKLKVKLKEESQSREEAIAAKDEKIKADNIATLKGMMQELNLDFD